MTNATIKLPPKLVPVLSPNRGTARYRAIYGGRGCLHPDALIDTPSGQVKVSEFKGGSVYSWSEGKIVVSQATPATEFTEEDLFEVALDNGRSIVATDQHKFLTPDGWRELCSLAIGSSILSSRQKFDVFRRRSNLGAFPSGFPEDAPRCWKTHANCQGDCSECCRQCDPQLRSEEDTYLVFAPSPSDARRHSCHVLSHSGDLGRADRCNPSSASRRRSTLAALASSALQCCAGWGNRIGERISELPLVFCLPPVLSGQTSSLRVQDQVSFAPVLGLGSLRNQAEIPKMLHGIFGRDVRNSFPSFDAFHGCGDFKVSKVESIRKHSRLKYWDLHVFGTNNYLSNGIVNHNSGKSFSASLMAAVWGYAEPLRILCVREFQASIKQSMHAEIKAAIEAHPWLEAHYDVGVDYIRGANGTEFIFRGLRRNEQSIKSLAKIDLTIVEEAEDIPEGSWLALEATVFRQPNSEIWALWNPKTERSPVDRRFRQDNPPGLFSAEINWRDNPYFPDGLKALREQQEKTLDKAVYDHVWEGAYLRALKGAYYADLLDVARKENRIGFYNKHGMNKVYAVWDIGSTSSSADATAMWIVQYVGEEIRWLDYYEAVGQPFEAHVNWLRENNYADATCVLPHDGVKHDNVYSVTPEKFLREAGFATYVVPNQGKGAAVQRIYALRSMFPQCRFNEDATVAGREALSWYHEKWDDKREIGLGPDHDWASHACLTGDAIVSTSRGAVQIKDVMAGDFVLTPAGYALVEWSGMVKTACETVQITLDDGRKLEMTPEHKVFTTEGVVVADAIGYGDMIITNEDVSCLKLENANAAGYRTAFSESMAAPSFGSGLSAAFTFLSGAASKLCCTVSGWALQNQMRLFPLMAIGTTSTVTTGMCEAGTSAGMLHQSIRSKRSTALSITSAQKLDTTLDVTLGQNLCTEQYGLMRMVKYLTAITYTTKTTTSPTTGWQTFNACRHRIIPCCTLKQTRGSEATKTSGNFAPLASWPVAGAKCALAAVRSVMRNLRPSRSIVGSAARVVAISRNGSEKPVYDLTVNHHHCYFANGVLVSNSDAAGLVAVFAPTARGESATKNEPIRRNLRGLA